MYHWLSPSISDFQDNVETSQSVHRVAEDGIRNYASAILSDGLLLLEFKDSIREGDGPRILRSWKALLLYFYESNHYNYTKEAVRMLACYCECLRYTTHSCSDYLEPSSKFNRTARTHHTCRSQKMSISMIHRKRQCQVLEQIFASKQL